MQPDLIVRDLGRRPYEPVWQAMQAFTDHRNDTTTDEFWLLEHSPVYTLGRAARQRHMLAPGDIPVMQVDRGGQVTYHGPGQIIVYVLVDLRRRGLGVRGLVRALERAVIGLLAEFDLAATVRPGAPGVYVEGRKIAALGLRIRRGCSFHGVALNADCDLAPFTGIDPCGYPGLEVTRTLDEGIACPRAQLAERLIAQLTGCLAYRAPIAGRPETEIA